MVTLVSLSCLASRLAKLVAGVALVVMACAAPASAFDGYGRPGMGYCWYPGVGVVAVGFGYCDYPAESNGSHWHCEWGWLGIGSCSFRWPDNSFAPPP